MRDGKIVAGPYVRAACERHLRDLEEGGARGLRFDNVAALFAIQFFGFLRHSKGEWAGQRVVLELWQQFVVGSVFGWRRADGTRRFRTVYEEVARKNGKSTKLAGIGLYMLDADGEPGAEVYAAATKKDQARIIFSEAQRMVRRSPQLLERVEIFKLNISSQATESKFEPLSSDENTLDGLNPHGLLIDELHRHKNRALLDVLDTAMGARRQPLLWIITTAGDDSNETVYAQEHEDARKIVEGFADDDSVFAYIATIDENDDIYDQRTWLKANPNLGVSVGIDDMRRQANKAKRSPSALNAFKRLRLNVRTGDSKHGIGAELWNACGGAVDLDALNGRRALGALDLSAKNDLTALVLLFPGDGEEPSPVLPVFWTPSNDLIGREDRDRAPYSRWRDEGYLNVVDGSTIDYRYVAQKLGELLGLYRIEALAFDRWRIDEFLRELDAVGVQAWIDKRTDKTKEPPGAGLRLVPWGQGFKDMNPAVEALDDLLLERKLRHGGHPILRAHAANVVYQQDSGEFRKPTKRKSTGRIDGIVALAMACGLAKFSPVAPDLNKAILDRGGFA